MATTLGRLTRPAAGGAGPCAARLLPAHAPPTRRGALQPRRPPSSPCSSPGPRRTPSPAAAAASDSSNDPSPSEPADIAAARARLTASTTGPDPGAISGEELRKAVFAKWGRDYAVLLARRGTRVFFQVLWKHLEQQSYPLSAQEHADTYDAVASYLTDWGAGGAVRAGIAGASRRGPGFTGGGAARAISIPLDVDLSTARGAEFL